MFFERLVLGCVSLSIWQYVLRCHGDASLEMRESTLSQPGIGFEPKRFIDDGISDAKLMPDNRDMAGTDYLKFDIDGQRLARDIDSVESNVNVNLNSLATSGLPWNMQRASQLNHPQESTSFGKNRKTRVNRLMRLIHQMPNSNFDYNLAHLDDHVNLQRKRNSRLRTMRVAPDEVSEELMPIDGIGNQCEPIVRRVVEYLQYLESNLRNLENDLWSVLSEPNYNSL